MQDAALVRVSDGVDDAQEQSESPLQVHVRAPTVNEQGTASHVLHDEVGASRGSFTGSNVAGDAGVIEAQQRFSFGGEPAQHFARVHAFVEQLDRDVRATVIRFAEKDAAEAAAAQQPHDAVVAEAARTVRGFVQSLG